jgi:hypothetical protein
MDEKSYGKEPSLVHRYGLFLLVVIIWFLVCSFSADSSFSLFVCFQSFRMRSKNG